MQSRPSRHALLGLVALVIVVSVATQWWGRRHEQGVARELATLSQGGGVLMIASDTCGPCIAARRWMQAHDVRFEECSIERDAACAERFRAAGGPGTPLMVVRGEHQLGFVPQRVRDRLRDAS